MVDFCTADDRKLQPTASPTREHDRDAELLAAALEGLYIGRDNKALLVARSGMIVSLNPLASELCGYSLDDLAGRNALTDLLIDPAPPDSLPTSMACRWETVLKTRSGTSIPCEVVREPLGTRLEGALVYAVRDLRQRKAAQAEREQRTLALEQQGRLLRLQNLRFDAAINNMPQGLAMLDQDQRLQVWNGRLGELMGLSPAAIRPGVELLDLLRASAIAGDGDIVAFVGDTMTEPGDGTLQLSNGRLLAISRRPMADGGLVITVEDVSERERDKRRLEDYTRRLESSNQELQSFAHVASHDLQEPLRKIETFIDRIISRHGESLPGDVTMPLERVQDAAQRMRRLITDLLGFAKLSHVKAAFDRVSLDQTLQGVLSDLHVRIDETKARIEAGPLPSLEADPTQLRQLLQNLLSNALKFSKPGIQPVIRVTGELRREPGGGDTVVLTIVDNGIGFDNKYKDTIFAIFQRLHGRSEYDGTGVGLATCRRIVDRHGGSIDASGEPGVGATFTVVLPVSQQALAA